MRNILIAVDDSKGSKEAMTNFIDLFSNCFLETCFLESLVLLYVEKYADYKETLEGTGYEQVLDRKARRVLSYYKRIFEERGILRIKTLTKVGHPAQEIINTAKEEGAEMIVMGSRGEKLEPTMMGSVSREVIRCADVSVLVAK